MWASVRLVEQRSPGGVHQRSVAISPNAACAAPRTAPRRHERLLPATAFRQLPSAGRPLLFGVRGAAPTTSTRPCQHHFIRFRMISARVAGRDAGGCPWATTPVVVPRGSGSAVRSTHSYAHGELRPWRRTRIAPPPRAETRGRRRRSRNSARVHERIICATTASFANGACLRVDRSRNMSVLLSMSPRVGFVVARGGARPSAARQRFQLEKRVRHSANPRGSRAAPRTGRDAPFPRLPLAGFSCPATEPGAPSAMSTKPLRVDAVALGVDGSPSGCPPRPRRAKRASARASALQARLGARPGGLAGEPAVAVHVSKHPTRARDARGTRGRPARARAQGTCERALSQRDRRRSGKCSDVGRG